MSLNLNQNAPENVNVIPLFSDQLIFPISKDQNEYLDWKSLEEDKDGGVDLLSEDGPRLEISETMDPLLAVMILNEKLACMRETLGRINFYLEELEGLIPKTPQDSDS